VSYQQLKNDIRCDIAIERLSKTMILSKVLVMILSFHDPSAFHRAFKNGQELAPAYRAKTLTYKMSYSYFIN
jgi:AraC-like DNA-binding protein